MTLSSRRARALASCAALLLAACRSATPSPVPMGTLQPIAPPSFRAMTYNIAAGANDLTRIAETIRAANADIVGLQEVDVHWQERSKFVNQADSLAKLLGMTVRFAPIYSIPNTDASKPPREFGVALLSRHPISAFTNHPLTRHSTQTPNDPPKPMPGFLEATVDVRGTPVRAMVTHLDYRADPSVREKQVSETLAILERDTLVATVLMGDLNATPNARELWPLFGRLRDVWLSDEGIFTYPADKPVKRIDYVLYRGRMESGRSSVILESPSDHLPVVADFQFLLR